MSVPIVVDEWLFHDLLDENNSNKQEETFHFLVKLVNVCDKIVVVKKSPFHRKLLQFVNLFKSSPNIIGMSRYFNTAIYCNSKKIVFLNLEDLTPLQGHLKKLPEDDHYLFQAYFRLKTRGSFILTTDTRWNTKIIRKASIEVKMRNNFINDYPHSN